MRATANKFAMSYVDVGGGGDAEIKTAFFGVEARNKLTQVLFFRLSSASAEVKMAKGSASMSTDMMGRIEQALQNKVGPYVADNIKNISI
jgi:hypothetical protein